MDILLSKVTQQAMNYAIRSGVTLTTTYAISSCRRLLKETPKGSQREELMRLQLKLESKIRIISPAIDMIELVAARGNTSLESAVSVTKDIRLEIQALGARLNNAANEEELSRKNSSRAKSREETERELRAIIDDIKKLLDRIEDAVPLINLAITTSGVNLSTKLSGNISPSRLLQASTFLTAADGNYSASSQDREQVGPTYIVSLYMLFAGHARPVDEDGMRETTWKETIHKARLKLMRVRLDDVYNLPGQHSQQDGSNNPLRSDLKAAEFAYQLVVIEDLDDDRVHTFENDQPQPGQFDDVSHAGIRDVIPVHEVSKIFYADTGKILNIGGDDEPNNPVLLLKRDVHAEPPRRMLQISQSSHSAYFDEPNHHAAANTDEKADEQSELDAQIERESTPGTPYPTTETEAASSTAWRLPPDLDPEWMAFEVYTEDPSSDSDEDSPTESAPAGRRSTSLDPSMLSALSALNLRSNSSPQPHRNSQLTHVPTPTHLQASPPKHPTPTPPPTIKTSLSLLETLLKLSALQQFRQESHLAIEDELLNFFLEDSATAGAGPDRTYRQNLRSEAVKRVGFDPYDESPIKRRGEEYISHPRGAASPRPSFDPSPYRTRDLPYDDDYGYGGDGNPVHTSIERVEDYTFPSSPSPLRGGMRQTPSPRSSMPASRPVTSSSSYNAATGLASPSTAPTLASGSSGSLAHRDAVRAKYASSSSGSTENANKERETARTPPSLGKTRQQVLRSRSEPKVRSPLGREFAGLDEGVLQEGEEEGG
ncbi:hypothetical protein MBLNU230_g3683t1 [Neophaeotheca triangularis]